MEANQYYLFFLNVNEVIKYSDLPILSGVIMSIVHVVSGPDHLAAVTPLAINSKKRSWSVGLFWGLGHVLGMMLLGLLFILLKSKINITFISQFGESIVGFMLVAIGIWAFISLKRPHGNHHLHQHPHAHENLVHIHHHNHALDYDHSHDHKKVHKQNLITAITIGIIHGIAGLSHLIAFVPTLALPSKLSAGLYLCGFGIGSIVAMVSYSFALGMITFKAEEKQKLAISLYLRIFGAAMAIFVGVLWLVFHFM